MTATRTDAEVFLQARVRQERGRGEGSEQIDDERRQWQEGGGEARSEAQA